MTQVGTPQHPLRVAIIGSGPSGFYAAEHLQKQANLTVEVDMYDRLPTPYGLVRGGVAPDHAKIKTVTKVYEKTASHPNFRFYGNVNFGTQITHEDLVQHYHAIIYAVGAQTDKNLGIPGENLSGSHAATEFVGWYNGHPDYRNFQFDLTQETAVVIGVGNVAMDVTRILARTHDELMETDIADYALDALSSSNIKTVYVLGRRGPAQAAFTNPEIKELGEMEAADLIIDPSEMELDEHSLEAIKTDRAADKNVQIMKQLSVKPRAGKPRQIIMKFLVSPVELIGTDRVEAIKIVHNELVKRDDGSLSAKATTREEIIPAGLVFRSVGYYGVALPGVPFYDKWGIIPNEKGRVLAAMKGEQVVGDYVVGWIKRGPSGIIGTNKPDSIETVEMLLEDFNAGKILAPSTPERAAIENLLKERGIRYVTFADWQHLDQLELSNGQAAGRPRLKFSSIEEMLNVLNERQQAGDPAGD